MSVWGDSGNMTPNASYNYGGGVASPNPYLATPNHYGGAQTPIASNQYANLRTPVYQASSYYA